MTGHDEADEPLAPPPPDPAAPPPPAPEPGPGADAAASKTLCANCGAELFGPHCYSCGQPIKGMVRQLSSILADIGDTILNIDSRIFRTLWPLLAKPGFLTNEYLAGRRVRYVTPFRLYFFLSVIAFLVMQVGLDATLDLGDAIRVESSTSGAIATAQTAEQVRSQRDTALAALDAARAAAAGSAKARKGIAKTEAKIRAASEARLAYLSARDAAAASGAEPPPDPEARKPAEEEPGITLNGRKWDPKTSPIRIAWLPEFANAKLNHLATRMVENLPRIEKDPKPFLIGAFGMLPQVLFLLMPLFALLLKIFYIFKRRLYMEHIMVALHSHAFIFLTLLLITVTGLLRTWTDSAAPYLSPLLGWIIFALGWWLPLYLLIMQKRVYKQGWFFTIVKYMTIGICYTILISIGVGVAFVISLATTNA